MRSFSFLLAVIAMLSFVSATSGAVCDQANRPTYCADQCGCAARVVECTPYCDAPVVCSTDLSIKCCSGENNERTVDDCVSYCGSNETTLECPSECDEPIVCQAVATVGAAGDKSYPAVSTGAIIASIVLFCVFFIIVLVFVKVYTGMYKDGQYVGGAAKADLAKSTELKSSKAAKK